MLSAFRSFKDFDWQPVVLDLFSRRIVGWAMRSVLTADLVTDALTMAQWRRGKPRELLHHSDHGSQYTSEQCQRLMAEYGVQPAAFRQCLGQRNYRYGDPWLLPGHLAGP